MDGLLKPDTQLTGMEEYRQLWNEEKNKLKSKCFEETQQVTDICNLNKEVLNSQV